MGENEKKKIAEFTTIKLPHNHHGEDYWLPHNRHGEDYWSVPPFSRA